MAPGNVGVESTITASDCAAELPQVLLAVTKILPPALPAVVDIEFVVELPLQPLGKVQV